MRADVPVEILVRPAEPFRVEPLVVGHGPDRGPESLQACRIPAAELSGQRPPRGTNLAVVEDIEALGRDVRPGSAGDVRIQGLGAELEPVEAAR